MSLTKLAEAPVVETANATMRTHAGPASNGAQLAVWRVEMAPGAQGPLHSVDVEQVVVVLEGAVEAAIDGRAYEAAVGDALILPAHAGRRLVNAGRAPALLLVSALPGGRAKVGDGDPVAIPWAR